MARRRSRDLVYILGLGPKLQDLTLEFGFPKREGLGFLDFLNFRI